LGAVAAFGLIVAAVGGAVAQEAIHREASAVRSFADDVALLRRHVEVVVLQDGDARLAVVPAYQGRVMTSSAEGDGGVGFGYINDEAVAAGPVAPRINVFGGEDRFWLGPEGGQYAIFFQPGDPFDLDHWQTPPLIDTATYEVAAQSDDRVEFAHRASVGNYGGFRFDVAIRRAVRLLDRQQVSDKLGAPIAATVKMVAHESENTLTNAGDRAWTKDQGGVDV
jgi:hypothetical protein